MAGRIVYQNGCLGGELPGCHPPARVPPAEDTHAGEATFVPRPGGESDRATEDDGFLLTFLYDRASDSSSFAVFDARSMHSEPLATVRLPQRVPFGFHGIFLGEQQLADQHER